MPIEIVILGTPSTYNIKFRFHLRDKESFHNQTANIYRLREAAYLGESDKPLKAYTKIVKAHQRPYIIETMHSYTMLIWAAPIPADRWHCSLWP